MSRQLRAVAHLVAEQWRYYAVGSVLVLVGIVVGLAYPWYVQKLIDEGVMGGHADRLNRIGLILLALLLVEGVSIPVREYFFNMAAERVTARLRQLAFNHLLRQDIAFFDRHKTGELTTRLWADVPAITRVVGDELAEAARFMIFALVGTGLLLYISLPLTLVVMLAIPPIVVGSILLGRRLKRLSAHMQEAYAESGVAAEESLSGIRTVRAFSQEPAEARRYERRLIAALDVAKHRILAAGASGGLSFSASEAAALLGIWAGGNLILHGRLTPGALIGFVLYAFLVSRGFRNVTGFWTDTVRGFGATHWIFELLAREPQMPTSGGRRLDGFAGAVALEHVRFRYPTRPEIEALAGVSLAVEPGEIVAFVGRSGAGKSTILNLLLRFYDPVEGRLTIDGHDIRDLDPSWLRQQIGVVMQDPVLFSGSVADNIRYGRADADEPAVIAAADVACAREFIERLPQRFETPIGDRGVQLSGGQRQRLAIARAVLRHPSILILDEATSALDSESEAFVRDALGALDYRPTTLIIAHRLSTVIDVDRVVVLDRGRIVDAGRHDDLLQTCPLYRQLVETQLVSV